MVDGAVDEVKRMVKEKVPVEEVREDGEKQILEEGQTVVVDDHGYMEAEKANRGGNASMLGLSHENLHSGVSANTFPQVSGHNWLSPTLFTSRSFLSGSR
jgi:hypothetical protein